MSRPNPAADRPWSFFSSLGGRPWFYAALAALLLAAFLCIRLMNDFDLGYHLRGGQWMVQNHRFFTHDVYTYTVNDHPYLDMHWLYQVGLYLAYRIGGYSFLELSNLILVLVVLILVLFRMRQTNAPDWLQVLLLALTVVGCETRFEVRPEVVTWLLMSLMLCILEARSRRGRDLLFLLPLIQLLWVNVEGLFALGLALMGAYVVGSFFGPKGLDRKLAVFSFLSFLVCFVNPYGADGVFFPLIHLHTLGTVNPFKQAIGEFQPSWASATALFMPSVPLWTYKLFCIALLLLVLATLRRRKVHEILVAAGFFYLSFIATRNISLFLLAATPIAATCGKDLLDRPTPDPARFPWPGRLAAWAFTLFLLCFCVQVLNGGYYRDHRSERFGWGLDPDQVPVQATRFLAENHLDGRILNQLNFGGWLDWQGPQKTFIDGRLEVMGEDFYEEYLTSYKGGLGSLADKYGADIIFFAPSISNWQFELTRTRDWRPVYQDGYFMVYLRKNYEPQIPGVS